ncbi:MAG TPA: BREX system P-loop protein BrxC, partial [Chloroflexota bacterium]
MKIGQLFLADVERDINPVIKVADLNQAELLSELEDYVVTDVIERYLLDFLEHYTDARQKETDRVGVWVSGYVGSGKSHFAKVLGLLTGNPEVEGRSAIDRFRPRIATCRAAREIERYLYEIATFLHTEVVAFQINSVAIKGAADDVCSILYRQFLAHRGLSTDLKLALLVEEPLIERGCLHAYQETVQELAGKSWEHVRQRPMLYWDEIFEALARTLPDRFKSAAAAREAYDRSVVQPTFQQLAKDLAAYVARQQARHRDREVRLLFIVDELGQFVADSGPRLLDIQSFAEEVATHGKGRIWLVVTSHESMHDVVQNAREFKGDIKKLEGRFSKRYTLTTENIERVLEERLFKKSKAGEDELRDVYRRRGGVLKDVGELVKADRALPACDADRFVACYPFLPYQLILIPDALHALRVAGGRGEALTGAARSLLGIAQGILKHQGYARAEVGRLVPLDEVYAEIEDAEIPSEVRWDLGSVGVRVPHQTFPLERILRALYLLQQVTYAPRTLDNLA